MILSRSEVQYIERSGGHSLRVEDWGNKNGTCFLFFHGGPGVGCKETDKDFFNPLRYRVLFIDQRGAGASKFENARSQNETKLLITDMLVIAKDMGIDQCIFFGGSWGSYLALSSCLFVKRAFAQNKFPKCQALLLRGYFPARRSLVETQLENSYFTKYPVLQSMLSETFSDCPGNRLEYLNELLMSPNDEVIRSAAAMWRSIMLSLAVASDEAIVFSASDLAEQDIREAQLQIYYGTADFAAQELGPEDYQLLADTPIHLVHGNKDLCCPVSCAHELKRNIPHLDLKLVDGNHLSSHPLIKTQLMEWIKSYMPKIDK